MCAVVSEIKVGTYIEPSKITFAQFLDRWLEDVRTRVTPKTHERYEQLARKNVAPLSGAIPLAKLKPEQISQASLRQGARKWPRRGGGGLSPRSVRQMHAIVKSALAQAVKWELLLRNPADAVKGPRAGWAAMQTYDLAQTAEHRGGARQAGFHSRSAGRPLWIAPRRDCGPALAPGRSRRCPDGGRSIGRADQSRGAHKEPKTGRGRTVALSATLLTELKAHRVKQAKELLQFGKRLSDDDFVVTREDGSPVRPHSLGQEWVRFLARYCSLPRIRFHDLRHAHATHLLSSAPQGGERAVGPQQGRDHARPLQPCAAEHEADAAALVDEALRAVINKREGKG